MNGILLPFRKPASPFEGEKGKVVGHGVVTKWDPDELLIKDFLAGRLILRGFRGLELEERSLAEARKAGVEPYGWAESYNTITTAGWNLMCSLLIGAGGTTFTNAAAALGVGDSNAAFALGQTNLQGAVVTTDRIRKAMNATFPSVANNVITSQSTFATGEANYVWNEWGWFNNVTDAAGTMYNRAVANLGTKTSASAWQLTVTHTFT